MENKYGSLIGTLKPAIKKYIDQLDSAGQIDRDGRNRPVVTSVDREGNNFTVTFSRNGQVQSSTINPRRRKDQDGNVKPDWTSLDDSDGWSREEQAPKQSNPKAPNGRGERTKKPSAPSPKQSPSPPQAPTIESYLALAESLLEDSNG